MPISGRFKPHAARVHQHHDIVARGVLNDDAHVAQTSEIVVGNNNAALCPFARLLQAFDSFAWVSGDASLLMGSIN
jgi:hypothetical protein